MTTAALIAPTPDLLGLPARPRLTLDQLAAGWRRWQEAHGFSATTRAAYQVGLEQFVRFAARHGVRYPEEATVLLLDAFYAALRDAGRSPSTVAHRRSILLSFWRWLEHEGFADRNLAAKTYPIKAPRPVPRYLEPHQIDRLLARLARLPALLDQRDHAIVATFFFTGLRVAELAALRLTDLDLPARRLRVRAGKGGRGRIVPIAPRLVPILAHYLEAVRPRLAGAEAPYVFVAQTLRGRRGEAHDGALTVKRLWMVIRQRAWQGLRVRLSPHGLRHTCATYLLYHGAQPETAQRLLGHADLRTTLGVYAHVPKRQQLEDITRVFGLDPFARTPEQGRR